MYDAIGNPLSYYNGTAYTFTWEGRQLLSAVTGGKRYVFTYNSDGIRTSKNALGVMTYYQNNPEENDNQKALRKIANEIIKK